MWHMTGTIMGAMLTQIAGVGISVLMLKFETFGKKLGKLGIIVHSLDLIHFGFYILNIQVLSTVFISIAGIGYLPLYALIANKFIKLSRKKISYE